MQAAAGPVIRAMTEALAVVASEVGGGIEEAVYVSPCALRYEGERDRGTRRTRYHRGRQPRRRADDPRELGGSGGPGNNPEQLFAACYAACFLGSMRFVASQGGPKVPDDARVTATVGIGPRLQGGFGLDVQLDIALPGMAQPDADALVQRAHFACPYSNAVRNNVPVRLVIV